MRLLGWLVVCWVAYSIGYAVGVNVGRPMTRPMTQRPPLADPDRRAFWTARLLHPTGLQSRAN